MRIGIPCASRFVGRLAAVLAGLAALALSGPVTAAGAGDSGDQLLRRSYHSEVTGHERDFFVYLPDGYRKDAGRRWPVMLFLHGNGERGDGKDDLDFVMTHGPLREAWIHRRPLPFVIVSPQLPVFGELDAIAHRASERPARLEQGMPPRNHGFPSPLPIARTGEDEFPDGPHVNYDPFSDPQTLPAGWDRIDEELIGIVDRVLEEFRADPDRVYLTGLSMGGFGAFHLAAAYPDRWAAMAAMVATGRPETAPGLAEARLPIWLFGGGKDTIVKPHWLYVMARALEEAGHPAFRFTMHEDMDHDAWKRVYAGEDLYRWFLNYRISERPAGPEKTR